MLIEFSKMHGLGNDFVVLDAINQTVELAPETVRRIADRHRGVGFDQLLLVEPPRAEHLDFHYRIFNADGSEAEQCGNGARCVARFVHDKGMTSKREVRMGTVAVEMVLNLHGDGSVSADMGVPELDPARVPFDAANEAAEYDLDVDGTPITCGVVSMGNPHCVIRVDDVDAAPVSSIGPVVAAHPRFSESVNVGFMQIVTPEHIRLRVHERVVGETMACGSGACAAVVVGINHGLLCDEVDVDLRGGRLHIGWGGRGEPVMMTGPTEHVYDGRIEI